MKFGVDVSAHQNPASLPWDKFAASTDFVIARASYGTMRDTALVEHVKRTRGIGKKVGSYHFFRPSQPVQAQLDVLLAQLDLIKLGPGDIVPALDIELDPFTADAAHYPAPTAVSKAWQEPVRQILSALKDKFGNALVYITQREFNMLGSPEWLLSFPLWTAHYTSAAKPATPGNRPFTIWQNFVGPFNPVNAGGYDKAHPVLDQNRAVDLPLIGALPFLPPVPQPEPTNESDDGLEDAIALHNQHLIDTFVETESAGLTQSMLDDKNAALREGSDTDPSELSPESERS